ncbi:MAG: hypothetical protein ACYCYF_12625, partial [Anaerolineae bacterium]
MVGNAFLFILFGPGDGVARLLPALAGVLVVMLPLFWRKHLGEVGALSASALILISPLALFAARRVDGAALATLGAGLLISLLLQSVDEGIPDGRWVSGVSAAGVAIGVIAGPAFYDLIVPGVMVWMGLQWIGNRGSTDALKGTGVPWRQILAPIGIAIGIGVGVALLISMAFGLRWTGWAGLADGAAAWLTGWRVLAGESSAVRLLGLYEPLLLVLAVAGLALLLRRPSTLTAPQWAIIAWPLLVLIFSALRPGSTPESLSAAILPTALLGGRAAALIAGGVRPGSWRWIGLHGLASFVFWIPG